MRAVATSIPELVQGPVGQALALLDQAGARGWLVGGAVRDAALGRVPGDRDIATDALPDEVMALAADAGIAAHPTGIDHGTVTLVIAGEALEITTLRRDVATDGRRAVVAFAQSIAEDAARRDFTINALYASPAGDVLDPLGLGLSDLAEGRVRFIGEGRERVREDYLRILRFFRFTASHGSAEAGLDAEGLAACAAEAEGLAAVSAERIWTEIKKLLATPDPLPALAGMQATGVLARILPGSDITALGPLIHLWPERDALLRLAAILPAPDIASLKPARTEARRVTLLWQASRASWAPAALGYRLRQEAGAALALHAALMGREVADTERTELALGQGATFPLRATDLPAQLQGAAIGTALRSAEAHWLKERFQPGRDTLLAWLERHCAS